MKIAIGLTLVLLTNFVRADYNPGDKAASFILPTLSDPLVYKALNNTNIKPPIIFHEFNSKSGFLEALWNDDFSILELLKHSPNNTQYVFFSSEKDAKKTATWMQQRFKSVIAKHYSGDTGKNPKKSEKEEDIGQKRFLRKGQRQFPKPYRGIERRSLKENELLADYMKTHAGKKRSFLKSKATLNKGFDLFTIIEDNDDKKLYEEPQKSELEESSLSNRAAVESNDVTKKFMEQWMKRLHFVTIPTYQFGNWIPLVTSRWYCSGHGCGLDQASFEGKADGDVKFVSKRLDARYDWLPSPYTLKAKHPKTKIVDYGDGCSVKEKIYAASSIILVSRKGSCSFFEKIQVGSKAKAIAVIIYSNENEALTDMTCVKEECATELKLPGTMITFEAGKALLDLLKEGEDIYVRFQHTPTRNFFLAIDEQCKLQELGWLLFPSMRFLTYQAEWMNYMTALLKKISKQERTINVFNHTIMHGKVGVVKKIPMPSLKEMQWHSQVYLDMSLSCPGNTDYSCPHWDHTVQLFLDCGGGQFAGEELGRWITPFRRRIGRWLTPIKPLIPMFTSENCTFTMKTVPWAMPWKPALRIQLSPKIPKSEASDTLVPYKIKKLFNGGTFDKGYNKKYKPVEFIVPANAKKVKIYAVITGHGSDENNCAEFCVTSHNFIVNKKYTNTRVFSNAGTPTGCADRVSEGVEPNEHGTWLYGRDGWCDGQEVDPWLEDITDQVKMNEQVNVITYRGYFNGKDPAPKSNPGYIIMHSFIVFYKPLEN
eukprot:gene14430-5486_t